MQWYTIPQAAKLLNYSRTYVYWLCKNERIAYAFNKTHNRYEISQEEINERIAIKNKLKITEKDK